MFSWSTPSASHGRFTLVEAAAIAEVAPKAAKHALNDVLGRSATSLGVRDILFLKLREEPLLASSTEAQRRVYASLRRTRNLLAHGGKIEIPGEHAVVTVKFDELLHRMLRRILSFRAGARRVERREDVVGGAVVFMGTRIPVAQVAALVKRGIPREELREHFPALRDEDFEFASVAAALNPPRGRPRKRVDFRRASGRARRPLR